MRENVVILSGARTAIGRFGGELASVPATRLGAAAIAGAIERAGVAPEEAEAVLMGNVLTANEGQAPARQAALYAGLAESAVATTINKVCASGMKAVISGAQSILLGDARVVVAGGMENMSGVPYYLPELRMGTRGGNGTAVDGVLRDGLWDPHRDFHMGSAAELCAREFNISREEQDAYAAESYRRAGRAVDAGAFAAEIVSVEVKRRKGPPVMVNTDEEPARVVYEKMPLLPPAFEEGGTVTAANASTLNDGAAALVLASGEYAGERGLRPRARLLAYAEAEQAPERFTTSPALAIPRAVERAGLAMEAIDLFEINEAYAVVALANMRLLGLGPERVNVLGGAVALGHPIGCSGARIIVTLLTALERGGGRYGVAAVCNGGGGASAVVIERLGA